MPSLVDSLVSHKEDETLTTGEGASTGNRDGESSQFLAGVDGYSQSICSLWNKVHNYKEIHYMCALTSNTSFIPL